MVRFVVMGAGKASRMGLDKLVMPWGDTTILGHVLHKVCGCVEKLCDLASEPDTPEIRVIARRPITDFRLTVQVPGPKACRLPFTWVQVPNPQPLAVTIKAGLSELSEGIQGLCFIPGDQVGLKEPVLLEMAKCFLQKCPDFLVPEAGRVTGSPVFFHRRYLAELMNLQGEQGGRQVLEKHPERWMRYPVDPDFFLDIDTIEEYEAYQKR